MSENHKKQKDILMEFDGYKIYEMKKYEIRALKEIRTWEKSKLDSFPKKFFDAASDPFVFLINKIGKNKFNIIENTIKTVFEQFYKASEYTFNTNKMISRAKEHGIIFENFSDIQRCYLKQLDECNSQHIQFHKNSAAVQGAAAGIGGELLAFADISALIIRAFHMSQNIAFCYGFNPNDKIEKEIILRIVEIALGRSDIKNKSLNEIKKLQEEQKNKQEAASSYYMDFLTANATNSCIKNIAFALITRMLACSVPLISIAISAHSNYDVIENTSQTGLMVYRKRFIERKQDIGETLSDKNC
ncbi:Mad12 [Candidatus Magnetomoraceae bacterium gMMP-15]